MQGIIDCSAELPLSPGFSAPAARENASKVVLVVARQPLDNVADAVLWSQLLDLTIKVVVVTIDSGYSTLYEQGQQLATVPAEALQFIYSNASSFANIEPFLVNNYLTSICKCRLV